VEIAFLERFGVARGTLLRAGETARRCNVSPDAALLADGTISERDFYVALAAEIGVPYYDGLLRAEEGIDFEAAATTGYARLAPNEQGLRAVVAPRGEALKLLLETKARGRLPIAIASRQRLAACLRAQFAEPMADAAAFRLADRDPTLSAVSGATIRQVVLLVLVLAATAWAAAVAPATLKFAFTLFFWTLFSCSVWLRSLAVTARAATPTDAYVDEAELPHYTIVAPLYREGAVAAQLVSALDALDYPRAKLDIKLVVERDDAETIATLAAMRLPACFDVIVAPPGAPKTKPRALNMALASARGALLVVYDAEDRPATDQLKLAAARFAANPDVHCIQARLVIENRADSWLTEMTAVEYAVLFDLFNPGLAALRLPIGLGGTSNHFRIESLRKAGGWDAWNVTEDADLGMRLARFGMRVDTIDSDTLEEAAHEWGNWFRQRVRWQKGWLQTLIVHSRQPRRLFRELGAWGTLSAFSLIAGCVSGGLFGALFFWDTLIRMALALLAPRYASLWYGDVITIGLMLWGVQNEVVPTALVMRRRRMPGLVKILLTLPASYILISLASWVALFELLIRPFHWGKTEHGREKAKLLPRAALRPAAPTQALAGVSARGRWLAGRR
jgi:cellulose synthase/poly-beta-1,6-N-acetylglucosamine synthase-like glycosyltransferase